MKGKVWLLNVWASWCVSCREEHPVLVEFAKRTSCRSSASTTRTSATTGMRWLAQIGNPYTLSVFDARRPRRHRLRRLRRARDLRHRQGRRDPLQADRPGHARGAAETRSCRWCGSCRSHEMSARRCCWLLLAVAALAQATRRRRRRRSGAGQARGRALAEELRCLVCQNQTHRRLATPSSPTTCAAQMREQIAAGQERRRDHATTWSRATAISCSTSRRSRRPRCCCGSARCVLLLVGIACLLRYLRRRGARAPSNR